MNKDLTIAELAIEAAEMLPAREALAFINLASITAFNSSLAANVLTVDSYAYSSAYQDVSVTQS